MATSRDLAGSGGSGLRDIKDPAIIARLNRGSIRYHFSNRSEDVFGLFTAALDRLDIP